MATTVRNLRYNLDKSYRMGRCGVVYPVMRTLTPEIIKVLDQISEKSKTKEGRAELYNQDFLKKFNEIYLGEPKE